MEVARGRHARARRCMKCRGAVVRCVSVDRVVHVSGMNYLDEANRDEYDPNYKQPTSYDVNGTLACRSNAHIQLRSSLGPMCTCRET